MQDFALIRARSISYLMCKEPCTYKWLSISSSDIAPDYAGTSSSLMNASGAVAGILSPVAFAWILDLHRRSDAAVRGLGLSVAVRHRHDLLDPARPPDRGRFQCWQVGGGGRVDHSDGSKRRSTSVASSAAAALPPLRGYPRPAVRAPPSSRERLYAPREPHTDPMDHAARHDRRGELRIARQMRSAVAGSSMCSTPNSASASTIALATPPAPG